MYVFPRYQVSLVPVTLELATLITTSAALFSLTPFSLPMKMFDPAMASSISPAPLARSATPGTSTPSSPSFS
ncbi:hypothetical protein BD309DRAFT_974305 [Dichomitus squalens]|nr:hypothetical protein BD309DRAFT_974305 [Dichomitus squalens]